MGMSSSESSEPVGAGLKRSDIFRPHRISHEETARRFNLTSSLIISCLTAFLSAGFALSAVVVETADPLLFGMSTALTGPAQDLGRGVKLGVEICFAEVNARGGSTGDRWS
jgi:ABC-type branched-subunit amino acid transport system substrate-binding protein